MNRREFLKSIGYTAAAGAAGVALSKLPDTPQPEAPKVSSYGGQMYWDDISLSTAAVTFTAQDADLTNQVLRAYEEAAHRQLRGEYY